MQGYFLKLLGSYRSFIYKSEGPALSRTSHNPASGAPSPHGGTTASGGASGGRGSSLARQSVQSRAPDNDAIKGSGYWFDHAGLVASHR